MNKKDLEYFKGKLEKEKEVLEDELATVGRVNPDRPDSWDATPGDIEVDNADDNEVADKMEELEENNLIMQQLEQQLNDVNDAIDKIKNDKYGLCEISVQPIEKERLEANPSARTCIKHMKS